MEFMQGGKKRGGEGKGRRRVDTLVLREEGGCARHWIVWSPREGREKKKEEEVKKGGNSRQGQISFFQIVRESQEEGKREGGKGRRKEPRKEKREKRERAKFDLAASPFLIGVS